MQTELPSDGPRVLLAEDCETARELTSALLQRMGCDVDAVEHGEQALVYAQRVRYDLILLDLDMPLMDGMAAAQAIRALPGNDRTLIMAISAFLGAVGDPTDIWRVFDREIPGRLETILNQADSVKFARAIPDAEDARRVALASETLMRHGIVGGLIMTLHPALGEYLVPNLLGGLQGIMFGNLIATAFQSFNWPLGSALSVVMLVSILLFLLALFRLGERGRGFLGEEERA
jgi:CheY-like chemotaxis protein